MLGGSVSERAALADTTRCRAPPRTHEVQAGAFKPRGGGPVLSVAWSSDGARLAIGTFSGNYQRCANSSAARAAADEDAANIPVRRRSGAIVDNNADD